MDKLLDKAITTAEKEESQRKWASYGAMAGAVSAIGGLIYLSPIAFATAFAGTFLVKPLGLDQKFPLVTDKLNQFHDYTGKQIEYNIRVKALKYHKNNWRPLERSDYRSDESFAKAKEKRAETATQDRQLFNDLKANNYDAVYAHPQQPDKLPSYMRTKRYMRFEQ